MADWIDAHNHLQDARLGDPAPIISAMRKSGLTRCIVNGTREDDWQTVENLHLADPDFILPAFGIHPWHAHTATDGWQDRLRELLEKHPRASIGECGLDRWIDSPDIGIQEPVFLEQLRIAREFNRAATIHCLKAWGPLFDAFDKQQPPERFLMHSFNGSIEIAQRLLPPGAYFSFSGYFLQARKSSVIEVFRRLPGDRILVETDAPDMTPPTDFITHPLPDRHNHPANLRSIGNALAKALGRSPEDLAKLTADNARRLFD